MKLLLVSSENKLKLGANNTLADKNCCCGVLPPFLLYQYETVLGNMSWFGPIDAFGCTWESRDRTCPTTDPDTGDPIPDSVEVQVDCKRRYRTYSIHKTFYDADGAYLCDATYGGTVNQMRFRRYTNFSVGDCNFAEGDPCIVQDFDESDEPGGCSPYDEDGSPCVAFEESVSDEYSDDQFATDRDAWMDSGLLDSAAALNTNKWVFQGAAWGKDFQSQGSDPGLLSLNHSAFRATANSRQDGVWRILFPPVSYAKFWIRTYRRSYTLTDDGIGNDGDCGDPDNACPPDTPCDCNAAPCKCGFTSYDSDCEFEDTMIETGKASAPVLAGSGAHMQANYGATSNADWHWISPTSVTTDTANQDGYIWLMKFSFENGFTPDDPPITDCPGETNINQ